jgi:hypothetical protein
VRSREEYDLSNRHDAGWSERGATGLFSAEIRTDNQPTHAVRDDIDKLYGLAVVIFQVRKKASEGLTQLFDLGLAGNGAIVEEESHFAIVLQYLVGDSK